MPRWQHTILSRVWEVLRRVWLLQLAIEAVTDISGMLVAGFRLGLPAKELDTFEKLREAAIMTPETATTLRRMRGFRNILVHEYSQDVIKHCPPRFFSCQPRCFMIN